MRERLFEVTLEERPGAEVGDLAALSKEIVEETLKFLAFYTQSEAEMWQRYLAPLRSYDPFTRIEDHTLVFAFPGDGSRSCALAHRWFALAFAANLDAIEQLTSPHGVHIVSPRTSVTELLEEPGDARFLVSRGRTWWAGRDGDQIMLTTDDDALIEPQLSADEVARATALLDEGGSEDVLTSMLLPTDEMAEAYLGALGSAEPAEVQSGLWYLGNTGRPSADLLQQVLSAAAGADDLTAAAVQRAMSRLSGRVGMAAVLDEALAHADPRVRAAALSCLRRQVTGGWLDAERAVPMLLDGLGSPAPACTVAAEHLGFVAELEQHDEVIDALVGLLSQLDLDPPTEHGAVLSLVNLHLKRPLVSRAVFDAIRERKEREGDLGALATWAVVMFGSRTPEA